MSKLDAHAVTEWIANKVSSMKVTNGIMTVKYENSEGEVKSFKLDVCDDKQSPWDLLYKIEEIIEG